MWKIERIVKKGDYDYAVVKNHPNAIKYGYVLYHRIVMENYLGRLLDSNEIVHHIDYNKKNNSIDNLELMTQNEHSRYHGLQQGSLICQLTCPHCKRIFVREKRQTHLSRKRNNYTACSCQCAGKISGKIAKNPYLINEIKKENIIALIRVY